MPREILTHKGGESALNDSIRLTAEDSTDEHGGNHDYQVTSTDRGPDLCYDLAIAFQNGPFAGPGQHVNGLITEVLLAIVLDRLAGFQKGDLSCEANETAIGHVLFAIDALKCRSADRKDRDVSGTYQP